MGLLISCYESCWGARIANGESMNPYTSVSHCFSLSTINCFDIYTLQHHRRRSQLDAQDTERKTQDEMCGLLSSKSSINHHVYTIQPSSSASAVGSMIRKPQAGMKFYPFMHSCTTHKFVK